MKYYKDVNGKVFAFEDGGNQDYAIPSGLSAISENEALTLVEPTDSEKLDRERKSMVVSAFQAIQALDDMGYLDAAESAVKQAGKKSQRAWTKATEFRRNSQTVQAIAEAVGITDEQLDDLFRHAATIEA